MPRIISVMLLLLAGAIGFAADPPKARPRPLQVLYLEESPRWEYRSHRLLLDRSTGEKIKPFTYQVLMQNADPEYLKQEKRAISELPTRAELDHFHFVILGDVDPQDKRFFKEQQEELARYVRDGGGLLVIAGARHSPHEFKKTPLADVLPIELGEPPTKERVNAERKEGYRPALTEAGLKHPAFRLDADAEVSRKAWAELPVVYWHAEGYTARKDAEVLATHPTAKEKGSPLPLIAWHKVGKGRCVFVGFDETWRWKANDGDRHYQTFWTTLWRFTANE